MGRFQWSSSRSTYVVNSILLFVNWNFFYRLPLFCSTPPPPQLPSAPRSWRQGIDPLSSFVLIFSLFSLWDHNCDTKVSILFKFLFLHFLFFSAAAFLPRLPLHMVEYHPGTFSTLKPVRIILIIFINNQSATWCFRFWSTLLSFFQRNPKCRRITGITSRKTLRYRLWVVHWLEAAQDWQRRQRTPTLLNEGVRESESQGDDLLQRGGWRAGLRANRP